MGDGFDVLDFNHLSVNSQLFDGILSSLRELIAPGSTHPQDFNLFHRFTSYEKQYPKPIPVIVAMMTISAM